MPERSENDPSGVSFCSGKGVLGRRTDGNHLMQEMVGNKEKQRCFYKNRPYFCNIRENHLQMLGSVL